MIVSCESCKSRYKLDDSKITGRGAKITCPKCKHVFVVLAPPPAVVESPSPSLLPSGGGEWEDEEPTRVGREAAAAAGLVPPPVPGEHEVVRPRGQPVPPPEPAAAAAPTKEQIAARAATLDFRKVGVNAWKVKVRIGLVYDFSDIKTLRKYIQDGRVTPADVISHDGKTWKPLGEIADLDAFFVESYERLESEYAARAPAARDTQPSPTDLGNVAAALAAAAAEVDDDGKSRPQTGPVYEDPFESLKQRQRDRGGKRSPPTPAPRSKPGGNNTPLIAGLVVLVLVLGGAGWWMFGRTPPPPPPTAKTEKVEPGEATPTKVEPGEKPRWQELPPEPEVPPTVVPSASDCPPDYEWNQKLQACFKPVSGPPGAGGPPNGAGGTSTPVAAGSQTRDTTSNDHESIGDGAMKKGDYNTAVAAYSEALSAGKSSVRIKLGEAQLRAGDQAGAMSTLTTASSSNKKALKLLGELKEQMGDVAGARAAYTDYVKAFPQDSAAKAHLDGLGG